MKKTWTLYSKERGYYQSPEPGQFAAVTTQKIAGRLDCHSGTNAKPENRIFLRYLEDVPKGFRSCKICKPELLRAGDRLDYLEKRADELQDKPHISLWATGMLKEGKDEYEPCRWYVALNWQRDADGKQLHGQHTLSKHHRYHKTFSLALKEGQRLNIPVIKHDIVDIVVLWLPTQVSTTKQEKLVKSLQSGDVVCIFGNGANEYDHSKFVSPEELT